MTMPALLHPLRSRLVSLRTARLLSVLLLTALASGAAASARAAEMSASPATAIAPTAAATKPLAVGTTAPGAKVKTSDGADFDLGAALAEKPTVLVFYRGGWCPYCNKQLSELAAFEPKFLELGFQIIALSTDAPTGLAPTAAKDKIAYRLLSDRAMSASAAYGVAFRVDTATVEKYRGYKIDLAPIPGDPTDGRWLPAPTVFVIGRDRVIRYMSTNPDFKVRLPAAELLAAAQAAAK